MTVWVNADWSAIVPEGSPDAAFGVQPKDLRRFPHLLPEGTELEPEDPPVVMTTANLLPAPEAKEADPPADKAAPKPADKAARRPTTKES